MSDPHHTPTTTGTPTTGTNPHGSVIGEIDPPGLLFAVFIGVVVLFLAQVGIATSGALGKYAIFGQLAIATLQAGLVAYYFMHLRHGDKVVTLTALSSIFWMGILFVLFMSDYMTRHKVTQW